MRSIDIGFSDLELLNDPDILDGTTELAKADDQADPEAVRIL